MRAGIRVVEALRPPQRGAQRAGVAGGSGGVGGRNPSPARGVPTSLTVMAQPPARSCCMRTLDAHLPHAARAIPWACPAHALATAPFLELEVEEAVQLSVQPLEWRPFACEGRKVSCQNLNEIRSSRGCCPDRVQSI